MKIKIYDYSGKKKEVKIKNFEEVVRLAIEVVSGDEILHILYKDYSTEEYDSCEFGRLYDFDDDYYIIYDITNNTNLLDKWKKRKDSYDDEWRKE